ncbi:MAG: hypothetical protein NTV56_00805 [Alphaproteobacteria bacterium]|nr:hypothetical protein [Alphaproteobacteria bacterium]
MFSAIFNRGPRRRPRCPKCGSVEVHIAREWSLGSHGVGEPGDPPGYTTVDYRGECMRCPHTMELGRWQERDDD